MCGIVPYFSCYKYIELGEGYTFSTCETMRQNKQKTTLQNCKNVINNGCILEIELWIVTETDINLQ